MAACLSSLHCHHHCHHHISVPNNAKSHATTSTIFSYYPSAILHRRKGVVKLVQIKERNARNYHFNVFAEVKKPPRPGSKEVVMVDPIEAKRLAVEQMQKLQARAKFKRQRAIEAINGGWAMLGLTAAIVTEGYTGKTILSQVAGYINVLADVLDNYFP